MPQDSDRTAAAFQQQSDQLRMRLDRYIEALWRSLGEYRNTTLPVFLDQVLPVVQGAMSQMQAMTASYLATVISGQSGGSGTPMPTPTPTTGTVRNGADPISSGKMEFF